VWCIIHVFFKVGNIGFNKIKPGCLCLFMQQQQFFWINIR